jgi:integrase
MSMLRLLLDTGMRRGELVGMQVVNIDFELDIALVVGRAADLARAPSLRRPLWRWIATCASGCTIRREISRHCGSASAVQSSLTEFSRSWISEAGAPEFKASIRVSSATPLFRRGCRRVATRVTLCGLRAGAPERCSTATERPQQMRGPEKRTGA